MKVVYLSGGVGGARLLTGLAEVMPPEQLTVVVNTGDDFVHWGLRICPDLDTVMYNLAGLSHPERGWGLREETYHAFDRITDYGAPNWFQLSDADLATHIRRTDLLNQGQKLSQITRTLCSSLGIQPTVLPMTDSFVQTHIRTTDGRSLAFQNWFVQERCAPVPMAVTQEGHFEDSSPVLEAINAADAILIGPSNPYVSIDPMLFGTCTRAALSSKPRFAVSPIVGGKAVKGPLADMIGALERRPASASTIADLYATRFSAPLCGMIVECGDGFDRSGLNVLETATVMHSQEDRVALARACLRLMEEELAR